MTPWTANEIADLRKAKFFRHTMADMLYEFDRHTRDEIVEALDALTRHRHDAAARNHVNIVLDLQDAAVPLINGKPMEAVATNWAKRPRAMF